MGYMDTIWRTCYSVSTLIVFPVTSNIPIPYFPPWNQFFSKFGRINFCLISNRDGLPSFLLRCYVSSLTCAPGRASVAGGSFRVRARRQSPARSGSRTACCRHTRPRSSPGASSWAAAVGSSRRWTTRPPDTPGWWHAPRPPPTRRAWRQPPGLQLK